ncbi:hypothetical protein Acr_05g0009960 [Actinidia rufa]|uniref:Uncharacterized protein n=1 Tax=Actinidia rufa TaxID=165716 RepID=A0A7J0EP67_9ERIC|nr:hypothetical protein Acr_05g0009960 [Actinidia rufa]
MAEGETTKYLPGDGGDVMAIDGRGIDGAGVTGGGREMVSATGRGGKDDDVGGDVASGDELEGGSGNRSSF